MQPQIGPAQMSNMILTVLLDIVSSSFVYDNYSELRDWEILSIFIDYIKL